MNEYLWFLLAVCIVVMGAVWFVFALIDAMEEKSHRRSMRRFLPGLAAFAVMSLSLSASPAIAAEGDLFNVGFQGIRISMEKPEFDLARLHTILIPTIEIDGCELFGNTISGGAAKLLGYVGLAICGAGDR